MYSYRINTRHHNESIPNQYQIRSIILSARLSLGLCCDAPGFISETISSPCLCPNFNSTLPQLVSALPPPTKTHQTYHQTFLPSSSSFSSIPTASSFYSQSKLTIMSHYYYGSQHHQPSSSAHSSSSHGHHGGRSRRAPRLSSSHNSQRQFRGVRSMKELTESPPSSAFRARFEAGRSFDLDDDLEFCPGLLTEDDVRLAWVSVDSSISKPSTRFADGLLITCLLSSYNQSIRRHQMVRCQVDRLNHHRSNIKYNPRRRPLPLLLYPLLQPVPTTLSLAFNQTIINTK